MTPDPAVRWAALVTCGAMLAAGCAGTAVATLPAAPTIASGAPPRQPARHAVGLEWDATGTAITCGRTGTRVRVRLANALVRHETADSLEVASEAQALVVHASRGSITDADFVADMRTMLTLLDAPLEHLEVAAHIGIGSTPDSAEIRASDSTHAQSYELTYRVIQRNGAALRIALLSRTGPMRLQGSLLAGVDDSPGFDLHGGLASRPQPATNVVWDIMRAIRAIDVFLHPFHAYRQGYDVPPQVPGT